MTNGTAQGLYIIIAVVIFGIFTLLSYLIFQDPLSPKLTNIFEQSFLQTEEYLKDCKKDYLKKIYVYKEFPSVKKEEEISFSIDKFIVHQEDKTGKYLFRVNKEAGLDVPWGSKYTFTFDVLTNEDVILEIDYNASPKDLQTTADYYTNQILGEGSGSYFRKKLKKNKKETITLSYENSSLEKNPEKKEIIENSSFLISGDIGKAYENVGIAFSNFSYNVK